MWAVELKAPRNVLRLLPAAAAMLPFVTTAVAASSRSPATLGSFFSGRLTGRGTEKDIEHSAPRTVALSGFGTQIAGGFRFAYNVAFSDGERQHKVWTFVRSGPGAYVGRRSDLVGDATVTQEGDNLHLTYTATVATKGVQRNIAFDELFTKIGPKTIENRLSATYLFLNVASSEMILHKLGK
jgi:Protein of unknown function (DUF3833)